MRFCELKEKEVINTKDCKRLGYISDLEIDIVTGKIQKIIIPMPGKFCGCLGRLSEYCIEFEKIKKIGHDIILVDVEIEKVIVKCKD